MGAKEDRACRIEDIVREKYANKDTDAADLAYETISRHPEWDDDTVARHVAQLVLQP